MSEESDLTFFQSHLLNEEIDEAKSLFSRQQEKFSRLIRGQQSNPSYSNNELCTIRFASLCHESIISFGDIECCLHYIIWQQDNDRSFYNNYYWWLDDFILTACCMLTRSSFQANDSITIYVLNVMWLFSFATKICDLATKFATGIF